MLHPGQTGSRSRVIINTDAKNEADDQYAIVHAALTPSFDLRGMIAAHYGSTKHSESMKQSRLEVDLIYRLLGGTPAYPILNGSATPLPDANTPAPSEGADLIVSEAMREDTDEPLFIAFYGPLTEMATALLIEPRIAERNVTVVWIGGAGYPDGGREYNLSNDIAAANAVFASTVEVWQVTSTAYRTMGVSYAELITKVADRGELGTYLVDQLVEWNAANKTQMMEYRSLGDNPAVGLIMHPGAGRSQRLPAPQFADDMTYVHDTGHREIIVYEEIDNRFILEDFFAKLQLWHEGRLHVS